MLYLTWMGMAAKIQQRNEIVNRQCVDLQERLSKDGFHSCILKGQGVASLYGKHLHNLRQSGDIDLWIPGDYQQTITYLKKNGVADVITAIHAGANFFDNPSTYSGEHTEVEVHPIPAIFRNPANHRKWKKICEKHEMMAAD